MSPEAGQGMPNENDAPSQNTASDPTAKEGPGKQQFPGCFKKTLAFTIDEMIIALISVVALFPFSSAIGSLDQHAWLPGFIVGAFYFTILDSSLWRGQSIGKMIFSIKVSSGENDLISPLAALGRYVLIIIPFYNIALSNSIASTVGITNTMIGGAAYLIIIGLLFSGNTFFMLFHPQKRGLHDILFNSAVVPKDQVESPGLSSFTVKPLLSGLAGMALLALLFGGAVYKVRTSPEFSDIDALSERIKKESAINNITASYKTFFMKGKQTMFAIEVNVPIPYDKFDDKRFTEELSSKLYPLVKRVNTNPRVDTITLIFHAQKYIGALPVSKRSRLPRKLSEIS